MVDRGKFFLYDAYLPALTAGKYELSSNVDMDSDVPTPVDENVTNINITAPRIKLPPDQVLMTFPPANSEGAYESRLPQVVLKRRTLPWDRDAAPLGTKIKKQTVVEETPWLALVIIAEGEGTIDHDIPIDECFSEGVFSDLDGDFDSATATRLSVPKSTIEATFPTIEDLIMLTHVREVNLDDTEAAMGDDDGFLSVIIANRMPQFDRVNCKPKAYRACLINLEGQLDKLPKLTPPQPTFELADIFLTEQHKALSLSIQSGMGFAIQSSVTRRALDTTSPMAITDGIRRGDIVFHSGRLTDRVGVTDGRLDVIGDIDNTSLLEGDFSGLRRNRVDVDAEKTVMQVQGTFSGFSLPMELLYVEEIYRFPVLTSWRFTCAGAGNFESLMRNLDVGLLGTKAKGGYQRELPDCTPDVEGTGPGEDTPSRIPLEIAETGHVRLPHLTRVGTEENSWYRSPFSPHRLMRRVTTDKSDDTPTLAHVSDHLRMMTPEGQQDVSLAVAFETGRLLAMSQPSFVASLMRWRAKEFGTAHMKAKQREVFVKGPGTFLKEDSLDKAIFADALGFSIEKEIFADISNRRIEAIAHPAPLVRGGAKIDSLEDSPSEQIAVGLGVEMSLVEKMTKAPGEPELIADLVNIQPATASSKGLSDSKILNTKLSAGLDKGLLNIAELAIGKEVIESGKLENIEVFDSLSDFLIDRVEIQTKLKTPLKTIVKTPKKEIP